MGLGDIEDLEGRACIVCPWHYYKIDLVTGEKYYQSVEWVAGKAVPGVWRSNGQKQRVHQVEPREDGIYVQVVSQGPPVASDQYACDPACGQRMTGAGLGGPPAGGDGVRRGLGRTLLGRRPGG